MKNNKFILLVLILLLNSTYLFSECPPNVVWGSPVNKSFHFNWFPGTAYVNYQIGGTSPNYSVKIDWASLQFSELPSIKEATWKKILTRDILEDVANINKIQGNFTISLYSEKECTKEVKLYAKLYLNNQFDCCSVSNPDIVNSVLQENGERLLSFTRKIVCGTKCCRKTYNCYGEYPFMSTTYTWQINSTTTTVVSDCSGTGSTDCKDNTISYPCSAGNCD